MQSRASLSTEVFFTEYHHYLLPLEREANPTCGPGTHWQIHGSFLTAAVGVEAGKDFQRLWDRVPSLLPSPVLPIPILRQLQPDSSSSRLGSGRREETKGKAFKKNSADVTFNVVRVRQVTHRYTAEVFSVPTGASALCPCLAPSSWTLRTIPRYCFHGMFLPCPCSGQQPLEIFQDGNVYCVSEVGFLNFNTGAK